MDSANYKIGCVSYFNARPLCLFPGDGRTIFAPPSRLSAMFNQGKLDVALLPVFELFRQAEPLLVDDVAIACSGPVRSVLVAHQEPLEEITDIWLDPASRTSIHLAQILFREHLKLSIHWRTGDPPAGAARVIIGDPALSLQEKQRAEWKVLDLGAAWKEFTGLPFVFAVWAVAPGLQDPEEVAELLRDWKQQGLARRREIARKQSQFPEEFLFEYLTQYIRYDLGDREKQGMELFRTHLCQAGFIGESVPLGYL